MSAAETTATSADELRLIEDAARAVAGSVDTLAEARAALDGEPLSDLWPAARDAGWPGLMISEERGGAGLGAGEASAVARILGRSLAALPLRTHLVACLALDLAGADVDWDSLCSGATRAHAVCSRSGAESSLGETAAGVVTDAEDPAGADVVVIVGERSIAWLAGDVLRPNRHAETAFDPSRPLCDLDLGDQPLAGLARDRESAGAARSLDLLLVAAESLGTAEAALEMALAYGRERVAFGRAIGSYQAVKHELVEVLRLVDQARILIAYGGMPGHDGDRARRTALAARLAAARAAERATRSCMAVHGGVGVTWEHDAHLLFRRAQTDRHLVGGVGAAADELARLVLGEHRPLSTASEQL